MKNILILGGTGVMGTYLIDILAENNENKIYVTSRKSKESDYSNVVYLQGDAHKEEFLRKCFDEIGIISVIIDFLVYSTNIFKEKGEFLLTHCQQYFYFSSSRVYANKDGKIKEDDPRLLDVIQDKEFLSTDEYALAKAREENILKNSNYRNWTIIRPYITYGDYRLQLGILETNDWLYRVFHGRKIVLSNDIINHLTTLTNGYDVALGIASLIGQEKALGETFHITTSLSIKWSDVLSIYLSVLRENGLDAGVVYEEKSYRMKMGERRFQVVYDRSYDREFDDAKISQFIDTDKFKNPQQGLRECLSNFLKKPHFGTVDWDSQARMDKVSGEYAKRDEFTNKKEYISYFLMRNAPYLVNFLFLLTNNFIDFYRKVKRKIKLMIMHIC